MDVLLIAEGAFSESTIFSALLQHGAEDCRLVYAGDLTDAGEHLDRHHVDVIVLGLAVPTQEIAATIRQTLAIAPRVPLVVLTEVADESLVAQALQVGAQDYLTLSHIDSDGLFRALHRAIVRKSAELVLLGKKDRDRVTLNSIGDAVASTDCSGNITYLNFRAEELTGWTLQDAKGRPAPEVLQILDANSREAARDYLRMAVEENRTVYLPVDCVLIRKDGTEIPVDDSVAPIQGEDGTNFGAVIVFRDVSASQAEKRELTRSAEHDFLTGLPNRLLLNDRVTQAIAMAERHSKRLAILFVDLDGFKQINDNFGHGIGDQLLQSVAHRFQNCMRHSDTVSRHGGDEFVILLAELEDASSIDVAVRRLLEAVVRSHFIGPLELHLTASIGVSVYPDDGRDTETLFRKADVAMYRSKANGRHGFELFAPLSLNSLGQFFTRLNS